MTSHLFQTYGRRNVEFVEGNGAKVIDKNGEQYLDFTSGIGVCNLGHCHPTVIKAVEIQLGNIWHISNLFVNSLQEEVASLLTEDTALDYVFFCNSGAEANEAALKLARKHTGKSLVVTCQQSFHGRTFGTMSATGQDKVKEGFGPLLPSFLHTPFNDIQALKEVMTEEVAAIMVEVVQGEGGVILANPSFLKEIEKLCNEYNALFIIDEVQTGIGRTGTLFAYEQMGIQPDIVTVAKALGNGIPVGAMIGRKELGTSFTAGSHGSTFGGNYIAMTAAKEVLQLIKEPSFFKEVNEKGENVLKKLQDELQYVECIQDIRGKGLMIGIECKHEVSNFIEQLEKEGLLVLQAGPNVIRLLPPLIVTNEELEQAVYMIKKVVCTKNVSII
ncbi:MULTISPECIES: acetylornithine transaminase [Bacillus cereus group]|uniref:Acetylornithine aminotransferase n=1 Tax=Bacillus cereus TaxID=1396 RepID=A0A2C0EE41_BACCE|nr:acetylornithine transaminase [Bacillus cereus]PDY82311.1 aspartate aminotransferase family protein [Bacillus cereus]PFA17931.1 aspartate aminotransferase family protein [Bacillus cereus]PFM41814.1 aspartate aminotransferase family protein [Bacillus cereus]PGL63839.1 aspartate aminotransferase family protein [Bacillus cereus]PGQ10182.1 aspartate aminotransferase family protein [Bacillus cereus]